MILQRIYANDKLYNKAYQLYQNSFPYLERRNDSGHNLIMQKPDYHFSVLTENEELYGIMLYFETEDFIYLEHFAVLPEKRGNGIGSKGLEILKNKGKTVILEIEYPVDDITNRRLDFYKRNGFNLTNHYHIQAKYHAGDEDLPLKILSYPHAIESDKYKIFNDYLNREVTF